MAANDRFIAAAARIVVNDTGRDDLRIERVATAAVATRQPTFRMRPPIRSSTDIRPERAITALASSAAGSD